MAVAQSVAARTGTEDRRLDPAGLLARGAVAVILLLIVATDLLVWKLLRREMGLGRHAAERIVIEMVTGMKGAS